MKKEISILVAVVFLLVACEQQVEITSPIKIEQNTGKSLEWIVSQNYSNRDETIWYVGEYPFQTRNYDHYYPCTEIELFLSDGYFNYVRESQPSYTNTVLLTDQIWSWKE